MLTQQISAPGSKLKRPSYGRRHDFQSDVIELLPTHPERPQVPHALGLLVSCYTEDMQDFSGYQR